MIHEAHVEHKTSGNRYTAYKLRQDSFIYVEGEQRVQIDAGDYLLLPTDENDFLTATAHQGILVSSSSLLSEYKVVGHGF